MLIFIWILNFIISWVNAWGCGKSWTESKHNGGFPHFMNWMGAIMSASGFTWCYTLLACFVAGGMHHEVNGHLVPYLTEEQVMGVASGGYLVVIFPILGSGIAIGIHSWMVFWRNRNLANGAIAGYNTFADVYNIYRATKDVPTAWGSLTKALKDSDEKGKLLMLFLVVAAVLAGVLTTYTILTTTARSTARERAFRYADQT